MKCRLLINDDLYHSGAGMIHLLGLTVFGVGLRGVGAGAGAGFREGGHGELHHMRSHPPSLGWQHSGDRTGKLRNSWR